VGCIEYLQESLDEEYSFCIIMIQQNKEGLSPEGGVTHFQRGNTEQRWPGLLQSESENLDVGKTFG